MRADVVVVAAVAVVVDAVHTGSCLCGAVSYCAVGLYNICGFNTISILAGSLDNMQGLAVKGRIYTSEKAGYYDITDGLPQYGTYSPGYTR